MLCTNDDIKKDPGSRGKNDMGSPTQQNIFVDTSYVQFNLEDTRQDLYLMHFFFEYQMN